MVAMFLFACLPLLALGAQPFGAVSAWFPAILIGQAGGLHGRFLLLRRRRSPRLGLHEGTRAEGEKGDALTDGGRRLGRGGFLGEKNAIIRFK